MKNYPITQLLPGMVVGRPVYNNHGQLILEADTILTENLISRLSYNGIYNVMIEIDSLAKNVSEEDFLNENILSEPPLLNRDYIALRVNYAKDVVELGSFLTAIRENSSPMDSARPLLKDIDYLVQHFLSADDLFDLLHNLRQVDDSVYAHSLNVGLIGQIMGRWLDFSQEDIEILTLCGLLHDIGKTLLPSELLTKPEKYTPEEFAKVKTHPSLGYELLKNKDLDPRIKNVVLMHHERCDGSGYPHGFTSEQLHDFTMIITIADIFDAMTMSRSYREALCPFQVISAFEKDGLQKYHPQYLSRFLENFAEAYKGDLVLLNNGQQGTIVSLNKKHLSQPSIQFDDGKILDMTTRDDLEIVAIL